ncbi:ABC1 kinase family protein [Siphonobacter aquaeclarae]|jgi:predicted unusual protein kinase regulating ubiquinone biosynthesis (AarF/ABC1/UbiB family)|uniref:Phosphotransferase enzyme family protein n=1 Tax=Siphonobacter aquaeclarae TaxID=563176 RepID=A0A1G9RQR1_9BACT|nr:AarF/ABC1/UbiB kinase family protein [Siphonobacter aquaeclarae]MBO9639445.1 AarF/ABC1/UbiB kinase family protein [Siphonobacter aquaeclarae]SDM25410.1 Phosphotransferase enzyme family protein [Siphonobacter aquaeclarae]
MKSQQSIPTSKVARATQFVKTGVKIGGNYLKHNVKKLVNPDLSRDELHEDNASDIYESLSQLKGSALKVAQMLSMDRNLLPKQYSQRFQLSQYSAPPLSAPLVVKTFQQYFGKSPQVLFDSFAMEAEAAASIGQVHRALSGDRRLAVKVQYPGVADSISSDLKMVKPMARTLFGLNEKDVDRYTAEVELRLLEETDYELELRRGQEITEACAHIDGLVFPKYYPEFSSRRVLTMDWLDGLHLAEFLATNPDQATRDRIGQTLWDFYDFQINTLRQVHADPHPGNFLFQADGRVGVIDFGCIKVIPEHYYTNYFALINPDTIANRPKTEQHFKNLEFLLPTDSPEETELFYALFVQMVHLLGRPFAEETFDFADDSYFAEVYAFAEKLQQVEEIRHSKVARGSQHGLYVNRTYFGLYSMLNELRARVVTHRPDWLRSGYATL